jgi:hypothetical protein
VVGGTHQEGAWDQVPRQEDKEFILAGGTAIEPSLRGATHLKDWVMAERLLQGSIITTAKEECQHHKEFRPKHCMFGVCFNTLMLK